MSEGNMGNIEAAEQAETAEHRTKLSVTGTQLRGLALTEMVGSLSQSFLHSQELNSKVKTLVGRIPGNSIAHQIERKKEALRTAITAGDMGTAAQIAGSFKTRNPEDVEAFVTALKSNLNLEDVIEKAFDYDFLRSLDVPVHTEMPDGEGSIIVPDLGTFIDIYPTSKKAYVPVIPFPQRDYATSVGLPLDKQRFAWADSEAVYGSRREVLQSQLEVFGKLASVTDTVHTHMTGVRNLPGILSAESFGTSRLRGNEASVNNITGLYVENGILGPADAYAKAIEQMKAGEKIVLPTKNIRGKPSIISSTYIATGRDDPIILFHPDVTKHRRMIGLGIVGPTRFDDPDLMGIWTPPTFKKNLLSWIGQWPEEKREKIFSGRSPESILISTPDDLPAKYTR